MWSRWHDIRKERDEAVLRGSEEKERGKFSHSLAKFRK